MAASRGDEVGRAGHHQPEACVDFQEQERRFRRVWLLLGLLGAMVIVWITPPAHQWAQDHLAAIPRAPVYECPAPTVNQLLVITVRYTEQHTIVSTCAIVVSRGQYKRERM